VLQTLDLQCKPKEHCSLRSWTGSVIRIYKVQHSTLPKPSIQLNQVTQWWWVAKLKPYFTPWRKVKDILAIPFFKILQKWPQYPAQGGKNYRGPSPQGTVGGLATGILTKVWWHKASLTVFYLTATLALPAIWRWNLTLFGGYVWPCIEGCVKSWAEGGESLLSGDWWRDRPWSVKIIGKMFLWFRCPVKTDRSVLPGQDWCRGLPSRFVLWLRWSCWL